jgi:hypothetical protein
MKLERENGDAFLVRFNEALTVTETFENAAIGVRFANPVSGAYRALPDRQFNAGGQHARASR